MLDRETGLVWQRTPPIGTENWSAAVVDCMNVLLSGRYGWRLPRMEEYRSLLDSNGLLPPGQPFSTLLVAGEPYWSSSTSVTDANYAFQTSFNTPFITQQAHKTVSQGHVWCVRGGAGLERL